LDRIDNVDLRDALREIARLNTYFYLDGDLSISIEQMERAAKINDYADKTLIWVSYPSGIDCYPEREVFQKDTRGYNGVIYHGNGTEHELKRAYAVDVHSIANDRVQGSLYEIDIKGYAQNVKDNAVPSDSIRIYVDDPHGAGQQIVMPKEEFNRRYPLDLVKMAYWRNEPESPEALKAVIDNIWNNERDGKYEPASMWAHTDKLYGSRLEYHADKLIEALGNHQEPNSPDKRSFTTVLDGRIAYAFDPELLRRLLEALPFDNAVFTVNKNQPNMNLVVPRDEVLELRRGLAEKSEEMGNPEKPEKAEKPSLLATLEVNEKKSKEQFGQKSEPGKDAPKKTKEEETI